ncbi:MAG: PD-(D/E)XK nuclease family protein [Prochlorotrichaceae cyanobacterium]
MQSSEIITLIEQELPKLIAQNPLVKDFVLRTVSEYYANKPETDSKFDRILAELQRDREEQARKWDEQNRKWDEQARQWDEQNRKWDEQARQWDEQNHKWDEVLAEIRRLDKRFDSTIGALGSRWGLASEASFRNALAGILNESFGVDVLNLNLYDQEGEVFGRAEQIEIDIIIKNGITIACEIKSSIDKAGMYSFNRKVDFYAKREQREVNRKIVISPMVDPRAVPVAKALGIEVYSHVDSVEEL